MEPQSATSIFTAMIHTLSDSIATHQLFGLLEISQLISTVLMSKKVLPRPTLLTNSKVDHLTFGAVLYGFTTSSSWENFD